MGGVGMYGCVGGGGLSKSQLYLIPHLFRLMRVSLSYSPCEVFTTWLMETKKKKKKDSAHNKMILAKGSNEGKQGKNCELHCKHSTPTKRKKKICLKREPG